MAVPPDLIQKDVQAYFQTKNIIFSKARKVNEHTEMVEPNILGKTGAINASEDVVKLENETTIVNGFVAMIEEGTRVLGDKIEVNINSMIVRGVDTGTSDRCIAAFIGIAAKIDSGTTIKIGLADLGQVQGKDKI